MEQQSKIKSFETTSFIKEKDTGSISKLVLQYLISSKIGYIHSIFKNSLNIKFGENLIHISHEEKNLTSFGCCIPKRKIKDLITKCKINDIVIKKNNSLIFYTILGEEILNLEKLKIMNLKIKKLKDTENRLQEIYKYLKKIEFKNKIGIDEIEVINHLEKGINDKSQKYLVGRGKGLTPSGDDILLSYSMVDWLCGNDRVKLIYSNFTTDISKQYFKAFNEGYISQYFYELFYGEIKEAIEIIKKIGHTSGYDILFGIFLRIRKFLRTEENKYE